MTKRYKVLKPFVDETGKLWTLDQEFKTVEVKLSMIKSLTEYGFIEEIKESSRWRAVKGQKYWSIGINPEWQERATEDHAHVYSGFEKFDGWDDCNYEGLNYFRSEETATKVSEALKLFFDWLHDDGESGAVIDDMLSRIEHARQAVLADDKES